MVRQPLPPDPGSLVTRAIIHVDMDAFFASVEERDRPELSGRPVIVGGAPHERGVVAAANYAARRFGVHSAMSTARAKRLCPQLVMLPPRHGFYTEVSAAIREVFFRYTPLVEPLSLDEAFLDVTASRQLLGPPEAIGRSIKAAIADELNLVASVGIASNKFLAKLASDHDKPDGFTVVRPEAVDGFLAPMPVTRLWGVGEASAKVFERLGIRTIGRLREYPEHVLAAHLGRANAEHLWRLARGMDERPVITEREAKSISHETTFARDITDRRLLRGWLLELTEQVGSRLRRAGLKGRTVQLKVRFADFSTITRARALERPTDVTRDLWLATRELLEQKVPSGAVRLVGMGVSGLGAGEEPQQALFEDVDRARQSRLDETLDEIQARFGRAAVRRGGGRHD